MWSHGCFQRHCLKFFGGACVGEGGRACQGKDLVLTLVSQAPGWTGPIARTVCSAADRNGVDGARQPHMMSCWA